MYTSCDGSTFSTGAEIGTEICVDINKPYSNITIGIKDTNVCSCSSTPSPSQSATATPTRTPTLIPAQASYQMSISSTPFDSSTDACLAFNADTTIFRLDNGAEVTTQDRVYQTAQLNAQLNNFYIPQNTSSWYLLVSNTTARFAVQIDGSGTITALVNCSSTPSPSQSLTPTLTPTPSTTPLPNTYQNVKYGTTSGSTCSANGLPVYSFNTPVVGSIIYSNQTLLTPLTGYSFILIQTTIFRINSETGELTEATSLTCQFQE